MKQKVNGDFSQTINDSVYEGQKKWARKCVNSKFLADLRSVKFLLIC